MKRLCTRNTFGLLINNRKLNVKSFVISNEPRVVRRLYTTSSTTENQDNHRQTQQQEAKELDYMTMLKKRVISSKSLKASLKSFKLVPPDTKIKSLVTLQDLVQKSFQELVNAKRVDDAQQLFYTLVHDFNIYPRSDTIMLMLQTITGSSPEKKRNQTFSKRPVLPSKQVQAAASSFFDFMHTHKMPMEFSHYSALFKSMDANAILRIYHSILKRDSVYDAHLLPLSNVLVKSVFSFVAKSKTHAKNLEKEFQYLWDNHQDLIDQHIFNLMVEYYCMNRSTDLAETLITDMQKYLGFKPDIYTYSSLMKGYQRSHNLNACQSVFDRVQASKLRMDSPFLISWLYSLAYYGKYTAARDLLDNMHSRYGVRPTKEAYRTLCTIYLRHNNITKASELLKEMQEKKIEVDEVLNSQMIQRIIAQSGVDAGLKMLNRALENGLRLEPAAFLFTQMVSECIEQNDINRAVSLTSQIEKLGAPIAAYNVELLIAGYCNNGDVSQAHTILMNMFNKYGDSVVSLKSLNMLLKSSGSIEGAERIVRQILPRGSLHVNSRTLAALVCLYADLAPHRVMPLFSKYLIPEFISQDKPKDETITHITLVYGFSLEHIIRSGEFTLALKIISTMKLDSTFRQLIDQLVQSIDKDSTQTPSEARVHLSTSTMSSEEIEMYRPTLNSYIISYLITCLGELKKPDEMCQVFDQIFSLGLQVHYRIYHSLIVGLCSNNRFKEANHYLDQMKSMHIKRDAPIFNIFLLEYSVQSALEILEKMERERIPKDANTIRLVVEAYYLEHNPRGAVDFFQSLLDTIIHDPKTYLMLIKCYCQLKNMNAALTLFERVKRFRQGKPDFESQILEIIVDGYGYAGQPEKILSTIQSMESDEVLKSLILKASYALIRAYISKKEFSNAEWVVTWLGMNDTMPDYKIFALLRAGAAKLGTKAKVAEYGSKMEQISSLNNQRPEEEDLSGDQLLLFDAETSPKSHEKEEFKTNQGWLIQKKPPVYHKLDKMRPLKVYLSN